MTRGAWREGRRAWQRLNGWQQDLAAGHTSDTHSAVDALGDIGAIRRLLDQAELLAVRTARSHGKSWAEIATMLGVSRQSAWERWRDVDDEPSVGGAPSGPPDEDMLAAFANSAADDSIAQGVTGIEQGSLSRRRRSNVVVPNVIGRTWDDARETLIGVALVPGSADPDGVTINAAGWSSGVVTDQSPESGARVPIGTMVRLWLNSDGGSAGVREPRRPGPDPKSFRASYDDDSAAEAIA